MASPKKNKIIFLIPVYNDWDSFNVIFDRIQSVAADSEIISTIKVIVINDGSDTMHSSHFEKNAPVKIIHLSHNLGHQKAIAIGLALIADEENCDYVVVIDSDGEDGPEDIEKLLRESLQQPGKIMFARRSKRSEGIKFKFFYYIYKLIFKLLTNENISFGNFSVIPKSILIKLVNVPAIWNHYASGVIKSKIPYVKVPIKRRKRICGNSKMNFYSLILHGLSAISVQIDTVTVRIILSTFLVMLLAVIGILVVFSIRMFTSIYLPGWATYVTIGLIIFLMQTIVISLILIFMVLNYRTQKLFIPIKDYKDYILEVVAFE